MSTPAKRNPGCAAEGMVEVVAGSIVGERAGYFWGMQEQ